jgi:MFS family permease
LTDSPSIETQHGHPGIVLATLSLANVMALLDLFVVNVALHDIGVSLHYQSSLSDVAWVLNAYALFFGALLIPAGRFADKYGRKATFILGLAVFTVASLACAVSPMALPLGDLPWIEQVELDSAGDVGDAGLARLAGGEVAGFLGFPRASAVGAAADGEAGDEDLEQECGEGEFLLVRGEKPRRCPSRRPGRAGS